MLRSVFVCEVFFFFFKQNTAYEMRISDWSSDVCSSDLELRSFQDWYLRYWLTSVPGVAEVASVGGYEKEYQVEIDPVKLQAFELSLADVKQAIDQSKERKRVV